MPRIFLKYNDSIIALTSVTRGHSTPTVDAIYVTLVHSLVPWHILALVALRVLIIIAYLRDCVAPNPGLGLAAVKIRKSRFFKSGPALPTLRDDN